MHKITNILRADDTENLTKVSDEARELGIEFFAVGVGSFIANELLVS